jgi:hypothetical protein
VNNTGAFILYSNKVYEEFLPEGLRQWGLRYQSLLFLDTAF